MMREVKLYAYFCNIYFSYSREELFVLCSAHSQSKILITHGTDTMIDTARYLGSRIKDKIIVITGAQKPEVFKDSDADFNIGLSLGALQFAGPGVYIAMNGVVHHWAHVTRDLVTGIYTSNL